MTPDDPGQLEVIGSRAKLIYTMIHTNEATSPTAIGYDCMMISCQVVFVWMCYDVLNADVIFNMYLAAAFGIESWRSFACS